MTNSKRLEQLTLDKKLTSGLLIGESGRLEFLQQWGAHFHHELCAAHVPCELEAKQGGGEKSWGDCSKSWAPSPGHRKGRRPG